MAVEGAAYIEILPPPDAAARFARAVEQQFRSMPSGIIPAGKVLPDTSSVRRETERVAQTVQARLRDERGRFIKADDLVPERAAVERVAKRNIQGPLSNLSKEVKGAFVGAFAGIGAAAAVGKGIDFIRGSFEAASGAAEQASKSARVFGGEQARLVAAFSESAEAIGLSDRAALQATGTFGNLFRAVGLTGDAAAGLSIELTKRGADLTSFNDVAGGVPETLEKIRSGLSGEAEPLKSLGIFLHEAGVAAEAMALGLAKSSNELTESDKVQARAALILKQSNLAAGDFLRTQDGLANRTRQVQATTEDFQKALGTGLVPVLLAAEKAALVFLKPLAEHPGLVDFATKLALTGAALYGVSRAIGLGRRIRDELFAQTVRQTAANVALARTETGVAVATGRRAVAQRGATVAGGAGRLGGIGGRLGGLATGAGLGVGGAVIAGGVIGTQVVESFAPGSLSADPRDNPEFQKAKAKVFAAVREPQIRAERELTEARQSGRLSIEEYVAAEGKLAAQVEKSNPELAKQIRLNIGMAKSTDTAAAAKFKLSAAEKAAAAEFRKSFDLFAEVEKRQGLSADELLRRGSANLRNAEQDVAALARLKKSGLSEAVIADLRKVDEKVPGTVVRVARGLTTDVVAQFNAQQSKLAQIADRFGILGANAGTEAGRRLTDALLDEVARRLGIRAGASLLPGPGNNVLGSREDRPGPGTPSRPVPAPVSSPADRRVTMGGGGLVLTVDGAVLGRVGDRYAGGQASLASRLAVIE